VSPLGSNLVVGHPLLMAPQIPPPLSSTGVVDLILMRHGQSQDNVFPRQGPLLAKEDPSLTSEGQKQAEVAGTHLASFPKPDLVFSSCLLRAEETALLAFPNSSAVHVAPHIGEINIDGFQWVPDWVIPDNTWHSPSEQENQVRCKLGAATAERLVFDWMPSACGPADWDSFLRWLWTRSEVRAIVVERLAQQQRPCFALASHGNFLSDLLGKNGWSKNHLGNTAAVAAELSVDTSSGFSSLQVTAVAFDGFANPPVAACWLGIASPFLALAALRCVVRRRRRQPRELKVAPPNYVQM